MSGTTSAKLLRHLAVYAIFWAAKITKLSIFFLPFFNSPYI